MPSAPHSVFEPFEYIIVEWPTDELVYIDGRAGCRTNKMIRINPGHHDFAIVKVNKVVPVNGTTIIKPLVIKFD